LRKEGEQGVKVAAKRGFDHLPFCSGIRKLSSLDGGGRKEPLQLIERHGSEVET